MTSLDNATIIPPAAQVSGTALDEAGLAQAYLLQQASWLEALGDDRALACLDEVIQSVQEYLPDSAQYYQQCAQFLAMHLQKKSHGAENPDNMGIEARASRLAESFLKLTEAFVIPGADEAHRRIHEARTQRSDASGR
ncbi:MAG: hypothetical protein ACKVOE_09285 [Rickettsiales bacterium]